MGTCGRMNLESGVLVLGVLAVVEVDGVRLPCTLLPALAVWVPPASAAATVITKALRR